MSQLHVLGIGSPFGDDQLGWKVIQLLQQKSSLQPFTPEQLHLAYYDRPGMLLLELMRPAHTVFLIDAIKTGAAPGTLHCFKNEAIETIGDTLSTHALGLAETMKMGATLQLLPKQVILYGVEIGDVQFQLSISRPIQQAIKAMSMRVESDIISLIKLA